MTFAVCSAHREDFSQICGTVLTFIIYRKDFLQTYGVLPLILVETLLGRLVLEGLLFELVRELLHVEVGGAAHDVLLQGVVDELVLLLGTGAHHTTDRDVHRWVVGVFKHIGVCIRAANR